ESGAQLLGGKRVDEKRPAIMFEANMVKVAKEIFPNKELMSHFRVKAIAANVDAAKVRQERAILRRRHIGNQRLKDLSITGKIRRQMMAGEDFQSHGGLHSRPVYAADCLAAG